MEVIENKPRYKASRKGMGGRKPVHEYSLLKELYDLSQIKGKGRVSVFQSCLKRKLSYTGINNAMRRVGLKGKKKPTTALESVSPVSPAGTSIGAPTPAETV